MSNITKYFEQAELAFAAYSNLFPSMTLDAYRIPANQGFWRMAA